MQLLREKFGVILLMAVTLVRWWKHFTLLREEMKSELFFQARRGWGYQENYIPQLPLKRTGFKVLKKVN